MSEYTSPAALPAHVITRTDVQAALRRHDFGTVFKLARQWGGISFVKIADACEIKPERVGKLARGEGAITTYEKILRISDALRIPGELVGLAPRPWEHEGNPSALLRVDGTAKRERDDVRRRSLFAATVGVAAIAGEVFDTAPGRRIGTRQVAQLRNRTARLRGLDDILGGADTQALYRSELDSTVHLIKYASFSEKTGKELLAVAAEQAQQAGWAAFDAGDHPTAVHLYRQSHSMATQADDRTLTGNSLAFLAYEQVSTGKSGVETAEASCRALDASAPPAVRALLHERRAWAHARAGQATETQAALQTAEAALQGPEADPSPDWASWVDNREHARDKALYMTWLAHAYLDAGEVERSVQTITHVLDLSAGVGSVRPHQRARTFLKRLQPHRAAKSVGSVLDRAGM